MGTHIDCFFPSDVVWEPVALQQRLDELCAMLASDVGAVRNESRFSRHGGTWHVIRGNVDPSEPSYLSGEGPAGLSINVYRRVICLTSVERFRELHDEEYRVAAPLRRLICSLAESLARPARIAVAAGGFGDTDRASDVAYYDGGAFDDVCRELRRIAGNPTDEWKRLDGAGWYLGPPAANAGDSGAARGSGLI